MIYFRIVESAAAKHVTVPKLNRGVTVVMKTSADFCDAPHAVVWSKITQNASDINAEDALGTSSSRMVFLLFRIYSVPCNF